MKNQIFIPRCLFIKSQSQELNCEFINHLISGFVASQNSSSVECPWIHKFLKYCENKNMKLWRKLINKMVFEHNQFLYNQYLNFQFIKNNSKYSEIHYDGQYLLQSIENSNYSEKDIIKDKQPPISSFSIEQQKLNLQIYQEPSVDQKKNLNFGQNNQNSFKNISQIQIFQRMNQEINPIENQLQHQEINLNKLQKQKLLKKTKLIKRMTGKNNKITKKWKCDQCQKQYDREQRVLDHLLKRHSYLLKQEQNNMSIEQQQHIKNFLSIDQLDAIQPPVNQIEARLQRIQFRLIDFQNNRDQFQSSLLAKKIVDEYSHSFNKILQKKLGIEFEKSKVNRQQINSVALSLLSLLIELPIQNIFLNPVKMLIDIFNSLNKMLQQKKASHRSYKRIQNAHQFILKIPFNQLRNQFGLLEALQNCLPTQKKQIINYYKKIVLMAPKAYGISHLPPSLLYYSSFKPIKRKILHIDDVKNEIKKLWSEQKFQLATDMFFVLVLGLRKNDLLKINIKTKNGEFARLLQIYQTKNHHYTSRCIPITLCKLIFISKNEYPISLQRLSMVRDYSMQKLGQFYGLRHCCLSSLFKEVLIKSNLNFHKSVDTSLSRYIDTQLYEISDKTFFIKIEGQIEIKFSEVKLRIQQFGEISQWQIKKQTDEFIIKYNVQQKIDDLIQDNIISKQSEISLQTNKDIKQVLHSFQLRNTIFKKFHQQFYNIGEEKNLTILDLAFQIINQSSQQLFFNWLQQNSIQNEQILNLNSFFSFFQAINKCFNQRILILQDYSSYQKNDIAIIKQKNQLLVTQNKASLAVNSPQTKNIVVQMHRSIINKDHFKKSKKKNNLSLSYSIICRCNLPRTVRVSDNDQSWFFYCKRKTCLPVTNQVQSIEIKKIKKRQEVKIVNLSKKRSTLIRKTIQPTSNKNNIQQQVNKYSQNSYKQHSQYQASIPEQLIVEVPYFSKETNQQIIKNRSNQKYLPLKISKSLIEGAGLGLFSTQFLRKQSIAITYSGLICFHNKINPTEDSLFQIGKFENQKLVFIFPKARCNSGRFINGVNFLSKQKMNCKSTIGLHQYQKNKFEVVVYIEVIRDIQPNQELIYEYGRNYLIL